MPTTPEPQVTSDIKELVNQLTSPFAFWRQEAEQALQVMTRQDIDKVFQVWQYLAIHFSQKRRLDATQCGLMALCWCLVSIVLAIMGGNLNSIFIGPMAAIVFGVLLSLIRSVWANSEEEKCQEKICHLIAEHTDDIRACGIMAERLQYTASTLRPMVIDALKRHLPRIQPEHHDLFNAYQRECLYRALDSYDNDFLLALLHAIEQIGNEQGIPALERLNRSGGHSDDVYRAAERCLHVLQSRAEEARAVQTLLRPSQQESNSPETLLRPATGQNTDAEQQQALLRPAGE